MSIINKVTSKSFSYRPCAGKPGKAKMTMDLTEIPTLQINPWFIKVVSLWIIPAAIGCHSLCSYGQASAQSTETDQPSDSHQLTLRAAISLSESKNALPADLKVGARYTDSALNQLRKASNDNSWFQIPSWLAGHWKCSSQTVYYTKVHTTGQESFDSESSEYHITGGEGIQMDGQGGIWTFSGYLPTNNIGYARDGRTLMTIYDREPIMISPKIVKIHNTGIKMTLSNSDIITSSPKQFESITTFKQMGDGVLQADQWQRIYDSSGKALFDARILTVDKRKSKFENIDFIKGRNMKKLFLEFLNATNRKHLIPKS